MTTIEGLVKDGKMHPMQEAFKKMHGLQCGFCTPGMVMSAIDLLQNKKKPSDSEIREWLEGNICRCTGYQPIIKAAKSLKNKNKIDHFEQNKENTINLLKKIGSHLELKRKREIKFVLLLSIFSSLAESVSIALLVPFVSFFVKICVPWNTTDRYVMRPR